MELSNDTVVMVWLGALVAPPILFGIWLRVKLALSEEGHDFLVARELEKSRGELSTPYRRREQFGEQRGQIARAKIDLDALAGSHGSHVATLLARTIPFLGAYAAYVTVVAVMGYLWVF